MPSEAINPEQTLLINLLRTISQNREVYPILLENLERLNEGFALVLRTWATAQFAQKEPAQVINLARIIFKLSLLIQSFEQGNSASNLEIAIAGYEASLQVCTREAFPNDWDRIQQVLVSAYQQRQNIVHTAIAELKQEMYLNQSKINTISEHLPQELQQAKLEFNDLKTAITHLKEQTVSLETIHEITSLMAELKDLKERYGLLENLASSFKNSAINDQFNTGIFYDIENLTMGRENPNFNFSLKEIQKKLAATNLVNKISIQCAYADWSDSRFRRLKNEIQELGIEPIQIFDFGYKKNAADIQLAIDVIELAHSRPLLQVFVIVSGDGAFASLAKKLHEYGKTVIGCAYDGQSNRFLKSVCDEFIPIPTPQLSTDRNLNDELVNNSAENWINHENFPKNEDIFLKTKQILLCLKDSPNQKNQLIENGIIIPKIHTILRNSIPNFDQRWQQEGETDKLTFFLKKALEGTDICLSNDNTKLIIKDALTIVND